MKSNREDQIKRKEERSKEKSRLWDRKSRILVYTPSDVHPGLKEKSTLIKSESETWL